MFKRKKKNNNDLESYEEDNMNLASKEEEIMKSYDKEIDEEISDENTEYEYSSEEIIETDSDYEHSTEEIEQTEETSDYYDEYEEDTDIFNPKKDHNIKRIINIIFIIIMLIFCFIMVDVICVARYDVGPFFAIPLKKYDDGGSKEYYGFGYKVIKYHQVQGRRDREIGLWNLKYNIEPVTLEDIDLAIEINGKETEVYKKYYKKFVRIISTLDKIDSKNNQITISYKDEDKKYSLDMVCTMETDKKELSKLKENEKITIIGTVKELSHKTKETPTKLYLDNCFAEQ